MNDSEFVFLYSTFPDPQSAARVAQVLVGEKLAACVNIHPAMTSVYEWEGKLETSNEVATFIKTRRCLIDEAIGAARKLHPYSVPCFVVIPICGGNEDYLEWVRTQTKQP